MCKCLRGVCTRDGVGVHGVRGEATAAGVSPWRPASHKA